MPRKSWWPGSSTGCDICDTERSLHFMGVKCQPHCHIYTLLPGNTKNAGEWSDVGWGARWEGNQEGPEHKQNADNRPASEAKAGPSNKQPLLPAAPVWCKCKAPCVCLSEFPSAFSLLLPCLQTLADVGECSSSHCEGRQRRSVLHTGARELAHSQTNREPGRGAGDTGKQRQRQTPTRQREREKRMEEKQEGKRKRRSWLERAQEKRRHAPGAETQRDKHQQRSSDTKTQGATETQAKAG